MKISALGVFLLGLPVSIAAQDSLMVSGLRFTVGAPRADVERSLQPRFRAELTQSGEWAVWDRATERAAVADRPPEMPRPPVYEDVPKGGAFQPTGQYWSEVVATRAKNEQKERTYEAQMRLYESQLNARAPGQTAPAIPRLPVGYVRFSDDGMLCQVIKEWNTNGGTPADAVRALAAALAVQKGRDVHIDNLGDTPCFLFPDTGRRVCTHAEGDGPASVTESTAPCSRAQPK
jgi:hypothetical protein